MDQVKVFDSPYVLERPTDLLETQNAVNEILSNRELAPFLAVVKAARNGAVYGAKVRFPHALVYELLSFGN